MPRQSANLLRNALKYLLALGVAAGLLWFVYKDIDFEEDIIGRLNQINYFWVGLSVGFSLIAFYLRAVRWNLLLQPLGFSPPAGHTFLALMVGYVSNIFVPRVGEVTRCAALRSTDNVPLSSSFGTVVAERVIDLVVLIGIVVAGLFLEFDKLKSFLQSYFQGQQEGYERMVGIAILAALAGTVLMITALTILRIFRHRLRRSPLLQKLKAFFLALAEGFLSLRRIKHPGAFWWSTAAIWLLYFAMAYAMFFAIPATSGLSLMAGFLVLIMGGLGMSAPVQGGFGTYHAFVSSALLLYGVAELDGKFFAFIIHTSQIITVLVFGGLSAAIVPFIQPTPKELTPGR